MNARKSVFGQDPYIIAEIGANHNGDYELACKMIRVAADCGADCVKFQIKIKPDELATRDYSSALNSGIISLENVSEWKSEDLGLNDIFDQMKKFYFHTDQYSALIKYANDIGISASASVFTKEGVDFLNTQEIAFIKVSSMDFVNPDIVGYMYSTGKPVIASTGMASEEEIEEFVQHIPEEYMNKVALLHCVSIYPPSAEILQLQSIPRMIDKYNITIGYSDHTIGSLYPLIAIGLGASIIEKHFTLDKSLPGWDHRVSADPEELEYICSQAKNVSAARGKGHHKHITTEELEKRSMFRRSLTTTKALKKGDVIQRNDITYKRPGTGIETKYFEKLIGRRININIEADKTLYWESFD